MKSLIKGGQSIAFVLLAITLCSAQQSGPFGFEWHSAKQDVIAKLGKDKIIKEYNSDMIEFSTAPNPHNKFDSYIAVFSPTDGLLKIIAFSKPILAGPDGQEVRTQYESVRDALTSIYGNPQEYNYVQTGSLFKEDSEFMMALLRKERDLQSFWHPQHINHVTAIALSCLGVDSRHAMIQLAYESEGYEMYADAKKKKADSVF